jgi:hypothetical protein
MHILYICTMIKIAYMFHTLYGSIFTFIYFSPHLFIFPAHLLPPHASCAPVADPTFVLLRRPRPLSAADNANPLGSDAPAVGHLPNHSPTPTRQAVLPRRLASAAVHTATTVGPTALPPPCLLGLVTNGTSNPSKPRTLTPPPRNLDP